MNIILLLFITFVAYGLGNYILRLIKGSDLEPIEDFVFSTGAGLGILAYAVFIAGQFKILYFWVVASFLLVLCVLFFKRIVSCIGKFLSFLKNLRLSTFSLFEKILLFCLISAFLIAWYSISQQLNWQYPSQTSL